MAILYHRVCSIQAGSLLLNSLLNFFTSAYSSCLGTSVCDARFLFRFSMTDDSHESIFRVPVSECNSNSFLIRNVSFYITAIDANTY